MNKTILASLLVTITTTVFASNTAIFNMTKSPLQLTYHVCTEVPFEGTKCDTPPIEINITINPMDGNGKNYEVIALDDDLKTIYFDKAEIRNGSHVSSYSLSCGGQFGGVFIIDNMGGTPALVCSYASSSYAMPNE